MKILCTKYIFDTSTPIDKINYFNDVNNKYLYEELDITEWVYEKSETTFEKKEIRAGSVNEYYINVGAVNIKLESNNYSKWFFGVEKRESEKIFNYWEFKIYDNNDNFIYFGTAIQEDVNYNLEPENISETIQIKVTNILQNFLLHLQNKLCENNIRFEKHHQLSGNYYYTDIVNFLYQLIFDNNKTKYEIRNYTGLNWQVNYMPYVYKDNNFDYHYFLTNGYERIAGQGITVFQFITKLFMAIGFDFKLYYNDNNNKIYFDIINRFNDSGNTYNVDESDILKIESNTVFDRSGIEYIVVINGRIKTNEFYTSDTEPIKIINEKNIYSFKGRFFATMQDKGSYYSLFPHAINTKYLVKNPNTNNADIIDFAEVNYTGSTYWNQRNVSLKTILNKNILFIDAGINSLGTMIDMSNKVITHYVTNTGQSETDVYFVGSYAEMLFTLNQTGDYIYYDFDRYTQTEQYFNNMKMLLNNRNRDYINAELNIIIPDIYQNNISKINITSDNIYYNGEWYIDNISINEVNNI